MKCSRLFLLGIGLAALSLGGCGDEIGRTVPVNGTVKVKDGLLRTGTIAFWPDGGKGNQSPFEVSGKIGEDGTYQLFTRGKRGAPPGWYRVTIAAAAPADPKNPYAPTRSLVPDKYKVREQTPLAVEVVDNPPQAAYDLVVK